MNSDNTIVESIAHYVKYSRGRFILDRSHSVNSPIHGPEIPQSDVILAFIRSADDSWPYDCLPTPRAVGSMCRNPPGCAIFRCPEKPDRIDVVPDRAKSRSIGAYYTPEPIVDYLTRKTILPLCNSEIPRLSLISRAAPDILSLRLSTLSH